MQVHARVRIFLCYSLFNQLTQEGQVGRDKVQVAQILKDHNVLVRGGPEQGSKLMEALVVSPHVRTVQTGLPAHHRNEFAMCSAATTR